MPIATSILDVVEAIKKQITDKAVGMSGTASPQAQEPPQQLTPEPPPDVDYTAGMQRPELTKLASNMEFKATPSRATAMLVALGNILQDKRNVEAAKQAAQQSDYDARFKDALDLTKARKGMQMKREFSEADPDVLLDRQLKKSKEARESEMFPLQKKYEQAKIDKLFKKTSGSGSGAGGSTTGLGSGDTTIDQEIKSKAWDYAQKHNVSEEEAIWQIANNELYNAGKNAARKTALGNIIKQFTPGKNGDKLYSGGARWTTNEAGEKVFEPGEKPLTPSQVEAAIKIKQRQKSNILASELPDEEAAAAMAIKDAEIAELEDALVDMIKSKLPKAQPQQPKEGSTAEKIVNGKKTTFIRQNGKWVSQ